MAKSYFFSFYYIGNTQQKSFQLGYKRSILYKRNLFSYRQSIFCPSRQIYRRAGNGNTD